ncbi:MAG: PEGA domain-containing protein [Planctomycetota bacterium]|jgi:hypothetical protein
MRTALLAAVLALTGCAGGELSDDLFPGNIPVDGEGRPSHLVVKVVVPEAPPAPVATAEADRYGWIRLPIAALQGRYEWLYFEADGYGPQGINAPWLDRAVALRPAVDVPLEVRDAMDRPVAGAQVDWHLGCGHTPAVRVVTTDAQGRAVLEGIDLESGEAWIKAPGLHSDYLPIEWEPDGGRAVVHVDPAPVHRGRVLDASGAPVAGAVVGNAIRHRGPWCRTAADGTFELFGLERGESLLAARSPGHDLTAQGDPSPAGHACVIRLPKEGRKGLDRRLGRKLHVKVVDANGEPVTNVEVLAVRATDGATVQRFVQPVGQAFFGEPSTGDARFDLQPGRYELLVEHLRGLITPLRLTLELTGGMDDPPLVQVLEATHATLKKLQFDGVPTHATVWVATAGRPPWDLTDEAQAAGLVPLPAEGPAVLKLVADGHTQYVPLERGNAAQTVTWNGPPPPDPNKVEWEDAAENDLPELPDATLRIGVRARGTLESITVSVDGEPHPQTTSTNAASLDTVRWLVIPNLPDGSREVVVAAPGHRAWRAKITLTKGRTTTVDVTLPAVSR